MSRNPLSSTNTRWAPRRAVFFYPRPLVPLPPGDRGLVALDRPPLGLLAAPAQGSQHLPHVRRVIADAEFLVDQLGHARQGPEIRPVPRVQRTAGQQFHELTFLGDGQSRRTSRGRFGLQSPGAFPSVRLPPTKHGTHRGADLAGDGREGLPRLHQFDCTAAALLQLLGRSGRSHESSCRRPPEGYAFFMQDSISPVASAGCDREGGVLRHCRSRCRDRERSQGVCAKDAQGQGDLSAPRPTRLRLDREESHAPVV